MFNISDLSSKTLEELAADGTIVIENPDNSNTIARGSAVIRFPVELLEAMTERR